MATDVQTEIMHVVHSLSGGGTERSVVSLLTRMNLPHVRHKVVTLRQAGSLVTFLPDHISCRALGKRGRSRSAFIPLAKLSRSQRTLIHARNTCCWADATLAAMLNPRVTLVLGFHGLETQRSLTTRHRWIARMAHYLGGRFVSVSESGSALLHREAGIPFDRIDVIHTGIDRKKFTVASRDQRENARSKLGLAPDTLAIGCIGSLTPVKNHEQLFRGFTKFLQTPGQKANLVLMGDGPCRSSLSNLTKHLGIESHVTWLGQCQEIASQLGAMDEYVCCSHSEGISNAMLEAMACGLPVITNDVGDHGLILRDGIDGLVLGEASVDAMASALVRLAGSCNVRKAMGISARERTVEFDVSRMVSRYESFYGRCLFPSGTTMITKSSKAIIPTRGSFALTEGADGASYVGTSGNDEQSLM